MSEYTDKELEMIEDMVQSVLLYDPYSMRYMEIPGAIQHLQHVVRLLKKAYDNNKPTTQGE